MKAAFVPLAILWLAAHLFLLALVLGLKFITAKTFLLLVTAGTALWFVVKRRPALSRLPGMV